MDETIEFYRDASCALLLWKKLIRLSTVYTTHTMTDGISSALGQENQHHDLGGYQLELLESTT